MLPTSNKTALSKLRPSCFSVMFARIRRIPSKLYEHKWKTIFGTAFCSYFGHYQYGNHLHAVELDNAVRRAVEEGEKPAITSKVQKVTVILNPHSGSGFSTKAYEDYAKPVLDCAGFDIRFFKTEFVKHERDLAMEKVDSDTDILVIAGGDTTVMNVLTGLNRRPDFEEKECVNDIPS